MDEVHFTPRDFSNNSSRPYYSSPKVDLNPVGTDALSSTITPSPSSTTIKTSSPRITVSSERVGRNDVLNHASPSDLLSPSMGLSIGTSHGSLLADQPPKVDGVHLSNGPTVSTSSSSYSSFSHKVKGGGFSSDGGQEWSVKLLQEELLGVQEECRRLRDEVAQKTNKASNTRVGGAMGGALGGDEPERSLSSLSWRGNTLLPAKSSYYFPGSVSSGSKSSAHFPKSQRYDTTGLTSLNRSLSTSNTSLSSVKSAREPSSTYSSSNRVGGTFNSAYSSVLDGNGSGSPAVELERARIKIRKLEKEVHIIEGQLASKTKQAESYVDEMTQLKSKMAQEKASNTVHLHRVQEKAASDMGRMKAVHTQQCTELENMVTGLKTELGKKEDSIKKMKSEIKGSQSEVKVLTENVSKLVTQLDQERETHRLSMERVQGEVGEGQRKVNELKKDLKTCQKQLGQCLKQVENDKDSKDKEIEQLRNQVELLSKQLGQCKDDMLADNRVIRQLQEELELYQEQLQLGNSDEKKENEKYRDQLEESETAKRKLVEKLERANEEISSLVDRLSSLQQSSLLASQLEGEVMVLRQSLAEQQKLRQEFQRGKEAMERESERLKGERTEMKKRLQQCNQQLSEMQQRSEEWRGEREKLNSKMKEVQLRLDEKERETDSLRETLRQFEKSSEDDRLSMEASINEMQQELTKRSQQVMDLDSSLRKHQAETAARSLQLERTLAQRQADLRKQTQEMEELSQKYIKTCKIVQELEEQLRRPRPQDTGTTTRLHQLEQQQESLEIELENAKQRENISKEQTKQVLQRNHQLQEELLQTKRQLETAGRGTRDGDLKTRDDHIRKLETQIRELERREGTGQEEVARCRAQVASLSAELSVERQILEETREELAMARTMVGGPKIQSSTLIPSSTTMTTLPATSFMHYNSLTNPISSAPVISTCITSTAPGLSLVSGSLGSLSHSTISSTAQSQSLYSSLRTSSLPSTSSSLPRVQPVSIPVLSFGGSGSGGQGGEGGGGGSQFGSIVSDVEYLELPPKQTKQSLTMPLPPPKKQIGNIKHI